MADVSPGFRMKQFYVRHDRSSMRVGTDAVLLGAWTPLGAHVLDIGTGCGIIALMVAQRLAATATHDWHIDAIDIDPQSAHQAAENFAASPWTTHLSAYCADLNDWVGQYDLIVSNPPFFSNGLLSPNPQRAAARQASVSLTAQMLMDGACSLLNPDGQLAVIVPATEADLITRHAINHQLNMVQRCRVCTIPNRPASRILLVFCRQVNHLRQTACRESELTLSSADSPRSEQYKRLTQDFYL